ncbi:hypothetical protein CBL_11518 [Carabus blaptoides fortunei]
MIDLKEYLKSRFQDYHKARLGFGISMESVNRQTRIDMQNLARKDVRVNVLLERRNINEMEIPTPDGKRIISKKQPKIDRLTLLKRWKAEKENRKKVENSKKKPVFIAVSIKMPVSNISAKQKSRGRLTRQNAVSVESDDANIISQ